MKINHRRKNKVRKPTIPCGYVIPDFKKKVSKTQCRRSKLVAKETGEWEGMDVEVDIGWD